MRKISVQTSGLLTDDAGYEEKFEMLRSAGFNAVDYNVNNHLCRSLFRDGTHEGFYDMDIEDILKYLEPFKKSAHKSGIEFGQLHSTYPSYIAGNDNVNAYIQDTHRKDFAIAEYLECKYVVVHPACVELQLGYEKEHEININLYSELIPDAKKHGVVICLENMFNAINDNMIEAACSDFREAASYIDELNNIAGTEQFGFCFDVGHANILGKNMRKSVDILGSRIKALHVHDNNATNDFHLFPYTYTRTSGAQLSTDWDGLLRGLADVKYQGSINFETYMACCAFPKPVHPQMLALLAAIGKYMSDEVDRYIREDSEK